MIIHHAKFADVSQTAEQVFQNCFTALKETYDEREARNVVSTILEDGFGISRMDVIMKAQCEFDPDALDSCIRRLQKHEPVQYVTGKAHFLGEEFLVTESVLIPRPETEEMVNWIVSEHPDFDGVIWDVGTGSGCIAIGISKSLKKAKIFGFDVSTEALKVARKNNQQIGASAEMIENDILLNAPDVVSPDIIVSNPPYIPESEETAMEKNVVLNEPSLALFVPNNDPLLFYRRIAEIGLEVLAEHGELFFEIHEGYGQSVVDLLRHLGYAAELKQDLQGKDRMVRARRSV